MSSGQLQGPHIIFKIGRFRYDVDTMQKYYQHGAALHLLHCGMQWNRMVAADLAFSQTK